MRRPQRPDRRTLAGVSSEEFTTIVAGLRGEPCPDGGSGLLHWLARYADHPKTPECPALGTVRAVQRAIEAS